MGLKFVKLTEKMKKELDEAFEMYAQPTEKEVAEYNDLLEEELEKKNKTTKEK